MTFEELGAALCAERERRGLSLDDVAAHLKISTRLIQALESGDLSALPHPAYTKGFLRAYASYMALDPEAVAEVAHALQPAAATECTVMGGDEDLRSNPAILRHGARQGIAGWLRVFILLILVVALAGGAWMLWQRGVFKDLTGSKEQSLPTAEPAAVAPAPEPVAPAPSATTPAAPAPAGAQTAPAPQGNGGTAAPAGGVAPVPGTAQPERSAAPAYTVMMDTRPAELTWGQTANAATVQDTAAQDPSLPAGGHLRGAAGHHVFRVLYGINFGLPVPEALHDMNEKFDGSGPRALKGDQINPHARLLAVVNAFCSMVSDRAYRQGMPIGQALEILSASPAFDPAIVLALREIPAEDLRSALAGEDSPSRA